VPSFQCAPEDIGKISGRYREDIGKISGRYRTGTLSVPPQRLARSRAISCPEHVAGTFATASQCLSRAGRRDLVDLGDSAQGLASTIRFSLGMGEAEGKAKAVSVGTAGDKIEMEARRKHMRPQTARRTPSGAVSADAKPFQRRGPQYFSV